MNTSQRLIDVIHAAGFTGQAADTMYAIDEAESGGNAWAYNPNSGTGDNSYGLSQINMIGSLGPARRQAFGLQSNDQLFDPLTNERAAYALSSGGTDFSPWSTFKSGAYQQYLGTPEAAVISNIPEGGSPHTDPSFHGSFPAASPGNMNGAAGLAGNTGTLISSSGFSWSDILPWNWGKDIKSVVNVIISFVLKLAFMGAGIGLVVLGAYRASGKGRESVAPLAMAAA